MTTVIHITHEAREKMGGIGAVLEGLVTARAYQDVVDRTILIGTTELPLRERPSDLTAILYESGRAPDCAPAQPGSPRRIAPASGEKRRGGPAANFARAGTGVEGPLDPGLAEALARVEQDCGVRLLYGRRAVACPLETRRALVEVVLLDVRDARAEPVNDLKRHLWDTYGLASDHFEQDWGYEEWVRAAAPALGAVRALLGGSAAGAVLVSHEFMGLPALLAARILAPDLRTIYWAHEVPPVRDLIESQANHGLVFDEAIKTRGGRRSYETILRESGGYKHALVSLACRAHSVFAVSDRIAQELVLLSHEFRRTTVEVVYNGLPARPIALETRLRSRDLLREYVQALVGFRPDFVFTHVARPVPSKSLERDLAVLEHLDDILAERGQTAVLLVLATDAGRRSPDLVRAMESEYDWPVGHREGWPDLVKGEVPIGQAAARYNDWARATRAILINQFGFDRASCGERMPEAMAFQDLRQGSDVEFGQSAYEPFGISQLETLAFGGICLLSRVCGCAQLLARVAGPELPPNILLAHYSAPSDAQPADVGPDVARRIEHEVAARTARELAFRLPTDREAFARLLACGWELAQKMSWQAVCRAFFVPALGRCLDQPLRGRPPDPGQARSAEAGTPSSQAQSAAGETGRGGR